MKTLKLLACLILAGFAASCQTEGEPSQIGEIMTVEQIASLSYSDSMNGQLVAVKGYPQFSRKVIKTGARNLLMISGSDGAALIEANVSVVNADKEGTIIAGAKPRNLVRITSDNTDIRHARFITDDYRDMDYGEFLFSGTLVYNNGACYLEKATIHPVEE